MALETPVRSILDQARHLISIGWCQNDSARDSWGRTQPESPHAIAWSISGAIHLASRGFLNPDMWAIRAQEALPHPNIWHFESTEGRTQADVLALFDQALNR